MRVSARSATRAPGAPLAPTAKHAGFTLIEIIVTLAILGIVMGLVYGVFAQALASKERTETRGDEVAEARGALLRMTGDLAVVRTGASAGPSAAAPSSARPTPGPEASPAPTLNAAPSLFLSHNRTEGGAPADDLSFTALVRRPSAAALAATDLAIIHYFVGPVTNGSRPGLYRETVYSLGTESWDPDRPNPAATRVLLENVVGLELRFFDGRDWVQEWDSTDRRNFAPAPQAVEIQLQVADGAGNVDTYTTGVDLPLIRATARPSVTPRAGVRGGAPIGGDAG